MLQASPVRYTWSGDYALAYQTLGEGRDLVYLPAWGSNLDWAWKWGHHARFLRRLGAFSRLILYDQRGTGCSDRCPPGAAPSLDDYVADLLVVLDTVNASATHVFAASDSTQIAMRAVARHPELFASLTLFNGYAAEIGDEIWASTPAEAARHIRSVERATSWDEWTRSYFRDAAPSHARDEEAIAWYSALQRLTEAPGSTISHMRNTLAWDLRDEIRAIRKPTLLISRGDQPWRQPGAQFLAERIPNAHHRHIQGQDLLPWAGDWTELVEAIQEFVTGSVTPPAPDSYLATVLFTDVVDSTAVAAAVGDIAWGELRERHHRIVRGELRRFRGRELETAGDSFLATFDAPARAVRCAASIATAVRDIGLEIRAGVHTGEVEGDVDGVRGIAVHIGARVAAAAVAGEVLVSQAVRDLTMGSGFTFADVGERELKGVPGRWHLFRLAGLADDGN